MTHADRSAAGWVHRRLAALIGLVAVWAAVTAVLLLEQPSRLQRATVGSVAHHDIYAPRDFTDATAVPPRPFKRGQRLVQQGDVLTAEHTAILGALRETSATHAITHLLGLALAAALLVGLGWSLLRMLAPAVLAQSRLVWLLALITVGTLALTKTLLWVPLPPMAVPLSIAGLLTVLLLNTTTAVVLTVLLAPLTAVLLGGQLAPAVVLLAGALGAIVAVRRARRRSELLRAGAVAGALHVLALTAIAFVSGVPATSTQVVWGLANGFASGLLVMGLLPALEHLFQLTTDIRLLELADLNHPILKELVLKAPGTYHHSLIVGNLAEAACESIGANALLARVGAYFHDIGKMEQAEYFIENQQGGDYLHEKLTPAMSGMIITNHVKRGMALAKKARLPQAIADFIPQHHGTGLVFYFYHKAMERYDERELAESDFRYDGPKPQTREAAVVLLADGIEASCRALVDPTPSRIRDLVRKIINARFIDGQLDECDLTLRDLTTIEAVFARVLLGIHHTRIQYPDTDADDSRTARESATPASRPAPAHPESRRTHS